MSLMKVFRRLVFEVKILDEGVDDEQVLMIQFGKE